MFITLKNSVILDATLSLSKFPGLQGVPVATEKLAKTFENLRSASVEIEKNRKNAWAKIFGDEKQVKESDPRVPEFNNELEQLLAQETKVNIFCINKSDLKLELNPIPPADLANISFVFVDW